MKLPQNVGPIDRALRLVAAIVLATLAVAGVPAAPAAYATITIAFILAATGLTGFCPVYALLGIRTVPVHR